jgi:hypothetical protein
MNKQFKMPNILRRLLPFIIVLNCLYLAGSLSFILKTQVFAVKSEVPVVTETTKVSQVLGEFITSPSPSPTPIVSVTKVSSNPRPTPQNTINPSSEPKTYITNNYITQVISTPIPSPTTSPIPSPSYTPTPIPTLSVIHVSIKLPDTEASFTVESEDGINACDLLLKAKSIGKINSVTLDDSYLSSFNTLLVTEINGFSNFWVFTVNGESPMGCSLVSLKNGDHVIWEYINRGQ